MLVSTKDIKRTYGQMERAFEHPEFERLKNHIRRFGMLNPVVITPDYRLLQGAARLLVYIRLGWDKIQCYIQGDS